MLDYNKILNKFIQKMDYLNNDNVEGIVLYGSFSTGFNTDKSDLDLHIIYKNCVNFMVIKGSTIIDGMKIDYIEKSLDYIYNSVPKDFKNQDNALLSIIGYGKIIYDRNGEIIKLQEHIKECFSLPFPEISIEKIEERLTVIYDYICQLQEMLENSNPYFNHFYHITIEKIQRLYHQMQGFTKLTSNKVYKLYTDTKGYRNAIHKTIPEKEFVDLYLKAIDEHLNNAEKISIIISIFNYITKTTQLNLTNYRIKLA